MMQLTHSPSSPFVRKALATAIETGAAERLTLVPADPWNPDDPLPHTNPLGKVPALVAEDGSILTGSTLVAEYLDSLHDGRKLFPAEGAERWRALRLHALADGMLEAAVARVIEQLRRPADKIWEGWIDRQNEKIRRTLDVVEALAAAGELAEEPSIGELTLACLFGYLDFRFPDVAWRSGRPALTAWNAVVQARPSLRETQPVAPQ
ncbi:MAG: glutathione S-transferase N-terminal domain-containing protein [Rhodospirillales bacterium]|nr:glutathione S-transferase N-terminal domain-containing protein [Rhodospirillales bacterium]